MEKLNELLNLAIEYSDKGEENKSIETYKSILIQKEDWSEPHYNLGLIYKYRLNWEDSFKHNLRAVELESSDASQWNLGIAATMLKEWRIARKCWNKFGMSYDDNDKDPVGNIGMCPIRLNPNDDGEVVWATRIDPARAIIRNIPFPESKHKYGDLILNDGAPMGTRINNGKEYSVLNELQIIENSNFQTYSMVCDFQTSHYYKKLESSCLEKKIEIENWTKDIHTLCKQCSEGTPHEKHEQEPIFKDKMMTIAFGSTSEVLLSDVLNDWSNSTGIDFDEFYKY